jgi:Malectin domain
MQLYQSYRYGGGAHSALHFAETNFTAAGNRLLNATINGAAVLSNLDIFAAGGSPNIAVVKKPHRDGKRKRRV